jgi:hypothetical protein
MKPTTIAALFLATLLTVLAGCASTQRGAAYGQEQEIRRQLTASKPMRDYGYTIKALRFNADHRKILVVFTHIDAKERPEWEFVLTSDEFDRYRGSNMQPFYTPGTANTPMVYVTVSFPPN